MSSGSGACAVRIFRVSGPDSFAATRALCGQLPKMRKARLSTLRDPASGEVIDQAVVLASEAPASFTGEDMVEFQVHGSPAVARRMLDVLPALPGLRLAEPGEFTRRAFEAGKLDLVEVEALGDLIVAETETQRRQALFHLAGGASRVVEDWREQLLACLSVVELHIDFADEGDVGLMETPAMRVQLEQLRSALVEGLLTADRGRLVREGVRIVLAGPANAGKSSLLNRLSRREAAIVSEEAGTTRDAIDVRLDLAGVEVIVTDTAGFRQDIDSNAERIGLDRTRDRIESGDVTVWLEAADAEQDSGGQYFDTATLRVWNKADLAAPPANGRFDLVISTRTGEGIEALEQRLAGLAGELAGGAVPAMISHERQRIALREALGHLESALQALQGPPEMVAEELRSANHHLSRLTGRIGVEEVLGEIFARFCIGK